MNIQTCKQFVWNNNFRIREKNDPKRQYAKTIIYKKVVPKFEKFKRIYPKRPVAKTLRERQFGKLGTNYPQRFENKLS